MVRTDKPMIHLIFSAGTQAPRMRIGRRRRSLHTLKAVDCQRKMRVALHTGRVQSRQMADVSAVSRRLKQVRQRAGLSIRQVAEALGMEHGSSYQHYEDRFKKPLLPLELVLKLVPIFAPAGIDAGELYALAGVTATGERPLVPASPRGEAGGRTI